MRVFARLVEGTWPACVDALRDHAPDGAEVVLLHVTGTKVPGLAHGAALRGTSSAELLDATAPVCARSGRAGSSGRRWPRARAPACWCGRSRPCPWEPSRPAAAPPLSQRWCHPPPS
ncbi:hypothetical protein ACFC8N_35705 [Streptomyces sp. NPDC055966]|uniref:hypothetical protein n=1 Tax=unclassified Streptomyces TaxID=2593676 RepID=UPI0035D7A7B8